MMESLSVNSSDVRVYTSSIASCRHPDKGRILFATRNIGKGEVVVEQTPSELAGIVRRYFENMEDLRQHMVHIKDKNAFLQHCCPNVGTGQICQMSADHFNVFFSHSSEPNCEINCQRFTPENFRRITATRPISIGDELTVNYDKIVGYEECGDVPVVRDFLALCQEHQVEKKPSRLTLPQLRVTVNY